MLDFAVRLRENAYLLSLLSHYAQAGAEDRAAWQDRVMRLGGVGPEELTALHGELIAYDGIEQNTGHAFLRPDGTLAACYRVTPHRLREFRRLHGIEAADEPTVLVEASQPTFLRKKRDKSKPPAAVIAE